MATGTDKDFYNRADAVIHLANEQIGEVTRGKVSASCMYATARFNAWVHATGCESAAELTAAKEETVDYFVKQYRAMLEDNLDDYIENFDQYIRPNEA